MKALHSLGWSEQAVQIVINRICNELNIPKLIIMPLSEESAKNENMLAYYAGKSKGFYQARLLAENDMKTALHELAHHVQKFFYHLNTPHDNTFTLALNKIVNVIKKTFGDEAFTADPSILRTRFSTDCECHHKFIELTK